MKSLLDWYIDIVNKPKMRYTIADDIIVWLIPIMAAVGAIVIFWGIWRILSKISDKMKHFTEKQCERIAARNQYEFTQDCDVDHGDYDTTSDWLDIDP